MSPNSKAEDVPRDPFGPAERISRAAAREAARGRRILWLYVALSLIPVLAALMFLRYGRSDRQLITSEVQAQVEPVKVEVQLVRPALQEVKQLGTLASEVKKLGAVASEVQGTVAKVQEHSSEIQELKSKTDSVAATMQERQAQIETLRSEAQVLRTELSTVRAEQATAQRRIDEIQRGVQVNLDQFRRELQLRDRPIDRRIIERERFRPHLERTPG